MDQDLAALQSQANNCLAQGRLQEAVVLLEAICEKAPRDAQAKIVLGSALLKQNGLDSAAECFHAALKLQPDLPNAWVNLAEIARRLKRFPECRRYLQNAAGLGPTDPDVLALIGRMFNALGVYDQALAVFQELSTKRPEHADSWAAMAVIHAGAGRHRDALRCGQRALALNPDHADALLATGIACAGLGELEQAETLLMNAIKSRQCGAHACVHLARVCMRRQRPDRAEQYFRRARQIDPDLNAAFVGLGNALLRQNRGEEADEVFREVCNKDSTGVSLHNQIGNLYRQNARLDDAAEYYRRALGMRPDSAEIHNNLANVLKAQGFLDRATAGYRKAVELKPDFWQAHSNLVFSMNYLPGISGSDLMKEHRRWAESQTRQLDRYTHWENSRDPDRPLRIGYISPDFHNHPTAAFMLPVLANHNAAQILPIAYADNLPVDSVTQRLQALAGEWRNVHGLDDVQLADLVREDKIDILVDLAGHTANNRLCLLARKPAPIQVSYLGYAATTGLNEIDFRITDPIADPAGSSAFYSEQLVYLENGLSCYSPPENAPMVTPLPARQAGFITFGSLNIPAKINDEVLSGWAEVLKAVPGSRLLLVRDQLRGVAKQRIAGVLLNNGIAESRFDLRSSFPKDENHLSVYAEIDIALDTWPWNGHATACEGLWMGVPVITLYGQTHAGRLCASVLRQLDLDRFVAKDQTGFIEIAKAMAEDIVQLEHLRATLRERMEGSRLCDGAAFTQALEQKYRWMWRSWCARGNAPL